MPAERSRNSRDELKKIEQKWRCNKGGSELTLGCASTQTDDEMIPGFQSSVSGKLPVFDVELDG